jgi:hypothetical protein
LFVLVTKNHIGTRSNFWNRNKNPNLILFSGFLILFSVEPKVNFFERNIFENI